jgi:uncharacterized protein YjiS (DUF1127 family)
MPRKAADREIPVTGWSPLDIRIWWPHPPALGRTFRHWSARRSDQRLLASLDHRALRDIGIDRALIDDESTATFWRRR